MFAARTSNGSQSPVTPVVQEDQMLFLTHMCTHRGPCTNLQSLGSLGLLFLRSGELAQQLRAIASLPEDRSSVQSSGYQHTCRQLTATCDTIPGKADASLSPHGYTRTCRHTHATDNKIKKSVLKDKEILSPQEALGLLFSLIL